MQRGNYSKRQSISIYISILQVITNKLDIYLNRNQYKF